MNQVAEMKLAGVSLSEMAALLEIISAISAIPSLSETLTTFTETMAHLAGVDGCAVSSWDREKDTVTRLTGYTSPASLTPTEPEVRTSCGLVDYPGRARVLQGGLPLVAYVDDPAADEAEKAWLGAGQWAGELILPLLYQGQATGLLELYVRDRYRQFTDDDLIFGQALANQLAVAIQHNRILTELKTQREALRQLSLQLVKVQEEERRRISRELHDELGQALTALKINLDVAQRSLPPDEPARLRHSLDEASSLAVHSLETARTLSLNLRPAILDDLGLVPALRWEIDRYERRTGQTVRVETDLAGTELRPELEITLYRIIVEALTNVARHAQAGHVRLYLQVAHNQVVAGVEDDGQGFDAAAWFDSPAGRQSLGLVSMRERAALLGGRLEVSSAPGHGTKVQVELPLNDR